MFTTITTDRLRNLKYILFSLIYAHKEGYLDISSDIILADKNFGCGSSREHAPIAIKAAGISCVIAKSFARIFYRNAFNLGLPVIVCPEIYDVSDEGDIVEVDTQDGTITNLKKGKTYHAEPIPPFMQEIIDNGGLMGYVTAKKLDHKVTRG